MNKGILLIMMILMVGLVFADSYLDYLTLPRGDARYCMIYGNCILNSLVVDNLTVYNYTIINASLFNINATNIEGLNQTVEQIGNDSFIRKDGTSVTTAPINFTEGLRSPSGKIASISDIDNVVSIDGTPGCFGIGTLVDTPTGQKEIQNLKVGDVVLSQYGETTIIKTYTRDIKGYYIFDGMKVTPEHPFFYNGGWVEMKNLPYDKLFIDKELTVYNLETASHTFYVKGHLVHNKGGGQDLSISAGAGAFGNGGDLILSGGSSGATAGGYLTLLGGIGFATNQRYVRVGSGTSTHSLDSTYDLLVNGELETNGNIYTDGSQIWYDDTQIMDDVIFYIGTGVEQQMFHDSSKGSLAFDGTGTFNISLDHLSVESSSNFGGNITIIHNGSVRFPVAESVGIPPTAYVQSSIVFERQTTEILANIYFISSGVSKGLFLDSTTDIHLNANDGSGLISLNGITNWADDVKITIGKPAGDGRFEFYATNNEGFLNPMCWGIGCSTFPTKFTYNDNSKNTDFIMEGNNDANLFYMDAGTDRIGIGTSTPQTKLDINGNIRIGTSGSPANITMYDPDGVEWNCGVDITGGFDCN